MGEVIHKSIFYLLLTAALQYFMFYYVVICERDFLRLLCCYIFPFMLLAAAFLPLRKIGAFEKRAWMVQNPAPFNPDMIDCYVRFTGKVTEERPCRLPLSGGECVYYVALVIAERQVKKKKPASGMETVRKPLLREQSSQLLKLADKECQVYVKVEEFTKSCLKLNAKESTQTHCPSKLTRYGDRKYKTYHLTEHFILHGDSVTAQGRLSMNKDGRLFIKPTHRLEFPSFLAVQKEASQFIYEIAEKARNDAWSKRINVAFLLLNAGLFIYFWH